MKRLVKKRPRWQYLLAFLVAAIGAVAIFRVANQLGAAALEGELELEPEPTDAP